MRIVVAAADIIKPKRVSGRQMNAAVAHKWLVENVNWGAFHCPDVLTVERHVANWAAIQKDAKVLAIIEAALQHYGRNNLLDWPTKLGIIVSKTDALSLRYVVETLYTHMLRQNKADPYGAANLRDCVIPEILWARQYLKTVERQNPGLFTPPTDLADKQGLFTVSPASRPLESPLAFFRKTEGPDRDPTWLQSLPNESLKLVMKHVLDLSQGLYQPEIMGALRGIATHQFSAAMFNNGARVRRYFLEHFAIAYDTLLGMPQGAPKDEVPAPEDVLALVESAGGQKQESPAEKKVSAFAQECEAHCRRELDSRMVTFLSEGSHIEIKADVTSTRLY